MIVANRIVSVALLIAVVASVAAVWVGGAWNLPALDAALMGLVVLWGLTKVQV